ncbi:ExbD/TolR family protein [Aurantiacibacter sp. MUD61]|uniref:ExbD/TolR family protein n=1 Tax=Aurantiacibacter sp. MUD61 TaxID=3009083 RepID=UPI0022F1095A|nr:hypothetical protein [Aurantiacibacter sp. MUD61]
MPSRLRRKRWLHLPHDHGEPLRQPRYDVVAGVLFTVTGMLIWTDYPVPTHAVTFDLPSPLPSAYHSEREEMVNRVGLTEAGVTTFNGNPVSLYELWDQLALGMSEPIEPLVVFDPHPDAAYGEAARTLVAIKASGVTKFCFARQEARETFGDGSENRLYVVPQTRNSYARRTIIFPPTDCSDELIQSSHPR